MLPDVTVNSLLSLILKRRCTISKPPDLSHMEMPSDLLLPQRDQVTQLLPSGSVERQDKMKVAIEDGGSSDLLFILP